MATVKSDSGFQEFWDAYSLKRDRIAAERAWRRLSEKDRRAALAGIGAYAADCARRGISRMYAQGYLNHRRWEDDFVQDVSAPGAPALLPHSSTLPEIGDDFYEDMGLW